MSCPYGFTKEDLTDEAQEIFEKRTEGKCPFGYNSEQKEIDKNQLSDKGKDKLEKLKTTGDKCPLGYN